MDLVELNLKDNNLGGQVPQCLTNFTYLKVLVLSSNQLSGILPSAFTHTKSLLKALRLTHCNLNAIPSFLLYQYDLLSVDLSHNKLVGTFPSWLLVNNTNLRGMHLVNNSFSGTLKLPNTKHDSITLFDISHNNFNGELPCDFLIGCFSLEMLNLSNNNFNGQIFPQYMNMPVLTSIYLNNNNFSGKIGKGLQNFTSLEDLDISNNKVSGQVPNWIGNFSNLMFLLMSKNLLEGHIPVQLSKLSSLTILDVSENKLTGPIPSSFNFSSIRDLFMQKNAFTGPIPKSLFRSSKLLMLNLRDNQFSGSIPNLINKHSSLRFLLLGGNHLQGPIPNQLCQLRNLSILDLSHNRLNGSIPSCFKRMIFWIGQSDIHNEYRSIGLALDQQFMIHGLHYYRSILSLSSFEDAFPSLYHLYHSFEVNCSTKNRYDSYKGNILNFMTIMDLSNNGLFGDIPPEIGDLQGIKALNLSNNLLSRSIPKSFSKLKNIESLDLSHNKLSGQIPRQLTELTYLAVFNVSYNNLSGLTPNERQFGAFDESCYIGNSGLCVTLINKSCTSVPTPPLLPSNGEEGEESAIDMVAFYWSFFGSYVTIILGLLVILWINSHWRMLWFYFIGECIDFFFFIGFQNMYHARPQ
ncbi:hypothetical protein Patl1_34582 [Pistacia atlantica]|uniref:Uncharacterized protein n=1 Tax=Pistacia atlantica TaxID=434234 RepID=A0ACC0ZUH8_9ROSI|nr:hypothetical protein Patl1_34582 [Pistacia atlantica]